jgi:hypothetical protein
MSLRTAFKFTLPRGAGIKTEPGRKASGTMRLIRMKDLLEIERDGSVQRGTGEFYVVLLGKVVTELGLDKAVNRKAIERLNSVDFAFLVDFLHEINHQVIKRVPVTCDTCGHTFWGAFAQLGEA